MEELGKLKLLLLSNNEESAKLGFSLIHYDIECYFKDKYDGFISLISSNYSDSIKLAKNALIYSNLDVESEDARIQVNLVNLFYYIISYAKFKKDPLYFMDFSKLSLRYKKMCDKLEEIR